MGAPSPAAVTITFWSHEYGKEFPHAFFSLSGTPDAGGAAVDYRIGFTARSVGPELLWRPVKGRLDAPSSDYVTRSTAQFAVTMTDAQYRAVLQLIDAWGERGDQTYDLNKRNCVTFVREAARAAGLSEVDQPALMKRPRSYLLAVEAANAGHVTVLGGRPGSDANP